MSGTTVNPFRWVGDVGYYWDEGTGTFYIRARVYEPVIGRWMSQDPLYYPEINTLLLINMQLAYVSGGHNLFRYVRCAPLHNIDPFGTQAIRSPLDCLLARYKQDKLDLSASDMKEIKNAVWNALEQLKRRGCVRIFMEGIFLPPVFKEEYEEVFKEKPFIFRPWENLPGGKPTWGKPRS